MLYSLRLGCGDLLCHLLGLLGIRASSGTWIFAAIRFLALRLTLEGVLEDLLDAGLLPVLLYFLLLLYLLLVIGFFCLHITIRESHQAKRQDQHGQTFHCSHLALLKTRMLLTEDGTIFLVITVRHFGACSRRQATQWGCDFRGYCRISKAGR